MNRLFLALLLAAACKHSSSASSSSHSETSTVTDSTSSETGATTTTTTVTEQPGETTTTTEEFLPPDKKEAAPSEEAPPRAVAGSGPGAPMVPRHGPLVKRTVTVTKSGGEKTETVQQATSQGTAATETKAAAKVDAKAQEAEKGSPALSCAFGGWLAIAGVVAALFGLGYFAIKRLRNPV